MTEQATNSQKGKSGILASVRASVGALSFAGEPGQREKAWKLWQDRFERATRWMAVTNDDKLDLLLLVGGEELQKLIQTLPEQPTDYKSHIEKQTATTPWSCTSCSTPNVVKTDNNELRSEIIRKNGDLKSVRETAKSFEVAREGRRMMKGGDTIHSQAKDDPEVKRVTRPGRYSMRSKGLDQTAGRAQAQGRPGCTKCGNEAHGGRNVCPATGRRCLKCGRLNHFARMCNKASNEGRDKQANSVEREQEPNTYCVSQEEESLEEKAGSENNEADYNSRHPEPLAAQPDHPSSRQAEFELRETEGEFEKDIRAIVNSSVPEAVTWQELLEETLVDMELSSLKEAIARGYFTLYLRDFERKMKMKGYADNKRYVKTSDLQIGDTVLVRRQAGNKATPAYETEPLQVQYRKGTRVVAKRADGSTITRTTAHFKKVPFRSAEDDQGQSTPEWPTEPVGESSLSTGENECPGIEQSNETIAGMGESVQTEGVAPTRPQAPQVGEEGLRRPRSERHRKETGSYLKEKYKDFQL
ncbi:hypothetical protein P5673_009104 [Acropora cervicornis]|uniref:CCHC-type domain-containing protein n=1 Tax=Acropora cervicornis TaxID=6130 RepID=A0AAD9V9S2_ACRCE|nr:hypothetical protein P5673_009104 [Acropora cervicornis]